MSRYRLYYIIICIFVCEEFRYLYLYKTVVLVLVLFEWWQWQRMRCAAGGKLLIV